MNHIQIQEFAELRKSYEVAKEYHITTMCELEERVTTAQLDEINELLVALKSEQKHHNLVVKTLEDAIEAARAKCDHKNPDGTTAIEVQIFCNTCKICYWTDY